MLAKLESSLLFFPFTDFIENIQITVISAIFATNDKSLKIKTKTLRKFS